MSTHLGKISFLDTPDVNGDLVLTSTTGVAAGGVTGTANVITVTGTTSPIIDIADNPIIGGTAGISIPSGTTAQRSGTPLTGALRFNTSLGISEIYNGTAWIPEGKIIQSITGSIAASTGTGTALAVGNSAPSSSTNGFAIWTQNFTPLSATSTIFIQYSISVTNGTNARQVYTAAYAGATCIGMTMETVSTAGQFANLVMQLGYSPGSTAAITFSARVGNIATASATYVNQTTTGSTFGAAPVTEYRILEVL